VKVTRCKKATEWPAYRVMHALYRVPSSSFQIDPLFKTQKETAAIRIISSNNFLLLIAIEALSNGAWLQRSRLDKQVITTMISSADVDTRKQASVKMVKRLFQYVYRLQCGPEK